MNSRPLSLVLFLLIMARPGLAATEVLPLISENFNATATGEIPVTVIATIGTGDVRVVDSLSTPAHPYIETENKSLYARTPDSGHTQIRFEGAPANYGLVRGTATLVFYPDSALTRSFFRIADFAITTNLSGDLVATVGTDGWVSQLQFGTSGRVFVSSGGVVGVLAPQKWIANQANVLVVNFDVETRKYSLTLNDEPVTVTVSGVTNTEFDFVGPQVKSISYANLQVSAVAGGGNLFYDSLVIEGERVELSGIEAWRAEYFDSFRDRFNDADPDRDGVLNLVEYALGGDPTVADRSILPKLEADGADLVLSFTRPIGLSDVSYDFEYSADLETWTPAAVQSEVPVNNEDGTEFVQVRAAGVLAGESRGFLRLVVEELVVEEVVESEG
jgi:hypothetical protein